MKFTLSWLKEFLDTDKSAFEIGESLTSLGLEVEEIIDNSESLSSFIVAEILEAEKHPEADKLRVCKVNNGKEVLQIVCGAPNARAGIKVVLAPIGAVIPTNGLKIKQSKIRNVDSNGMLCSATELGIGNDSAGIIELDENAKIGNLFVDEAGLNDPIIHISITPNRGDCLGVYGIARDLAAKGIGKLKVREEIVEKNLSRSNFKIQADQSISPLFVTKIIRNANNKVKTPNWMKRRLEAAGCSSISPIVDITNYINFTYNRPLHAYDLEKLSGSLNVTMAKSGEKFRALNQKEYILDENDIVIRDEQNIQGLAGIIGGEYSSCTNDTVNILLEAAVFNVKNIIKTGRKLNIDTDSRYRFERHIDYNFTYQGLLEAEKLILEICGGEAEAANILGNDKKDNIKLNINLDKFYKFSGMEIEKKIIMFILQSLKFNIVDKENELELEVPSHRNDIDHDRDIYEEILRIYGYNNIIQTSPIDEHKFSPVLSKEHRRVAMLRRLMASSGITEVVTFSFINSENQKYFGEIKDNLLLKNPVSSDLNLMRSSIIPNFIEIYKKNTARGFFDISVFEIGPVFYGLNPEDEKLVLSLLRTGRNAKKDFFKREEIFDFYDVKADFENILKECNFDINSLKLERSNNIFLHPGRSAEFKLGNQLIGYIGEIHPILMKNMDIDNKYPLIVMEVFLQNIPYSKPKFGKKAAPNYSDFQVIERDFAFLVDEKLEAGNIIKQIKAVDKNLITEVTIFDIYQGDKIEKGKKSIALNVKIEPQEATLTDGEIEKLSNDIIAKISTIGGILRG